MPSGDHTRWLGAYWSKYGSTWFTNSDESEMIAGDVAAPVATSTNCSETSTPAASADGWVAPDPSRAEARRAVARVPPTVAAGGLTVLGMPSVAIVLPSGDQKNATTSFTGSARTSPVDASTIRTGPNGSGATRSPSPGAMNATCGPDGANPTAAGPNTGIWWLVDPSLVPTTTASVLGDGATTYASYRPSADADGARNTPGRPATLDIVVPSIPTAPRNASVSEPVWTSIRSGPSQAQYIGWPWRSTRAAALPSAGTDWSERSGPFAVRKVTPRLSGVQYR